MTHRRLPALSRLSSQSRSRFLCARGFAVAALVAAAGVAQAQAYRCASSAGTYFSDRPCPITPAPTVGVIGPARGTPPVPYSPPLPGAPKAPEHVKYLSAECASISEAIRTGPSRGVRKDVIAALNEEYRKKCSLEDQDARKRAREDESHEMQAKVAQRESENAQRVQSEARNAQCFAMRDVIALKRKREAQLNEKEVEALRDLERSYNERCLAR